MPRPIIPPIPDDGSIEPLVRRALMGMRAVLNSLVRKTYIDRESAQIWKLAFTAADIPVHHTTHESGGSDPIKLDDLALPDDNTDLNASTSRHGLLRKLSNVASEFLNGQGSFAAIAAGDLPNHATRHESGGADPLQLDNLAAPDDNTDLNASTTKHGLLPKLSNVVTQFLNGQGGWTVPPGTYASPTTTTGDLIFNNGGGAGVDARLGIGSTGDILNVVSGVPAWTAIETAVAGKYVRRAPFYKPFTPAGDDDEFDDASFTGWTLVNSGSPIPTITEDHDMACIVHPGGDAAAELTAWVKAMTLGANDYVEAWFEFFCRNSTTPSVGVLMTNGSTHGAGTQVFWDIFNNTTTLQLGLASHTNFTTAGTSTTFNMTHSLFSGRGIGLRLVYEGSNNWSGWVSMNGVEWLNVTGTLARTMTPTHAGFFISSWGSASPMRANVHYCRFVV